MEKKTLIRRNALSKRNNLSPEEVLSCSEKINNNVINSSLGDGVKEIFLYASTGTEVSTDKLFEYFSERNVDIFYPKVLSDNTMEFYQVNLLSDLIEGYMGIREPDISVCRKYEGDLGPDIVFVPGVAFDQEFNRMGYGKGYYDRYFDKSSKVTKVGLCYDLQILKQIPTEKTDVKMDYLITEKGLWKRENYN